jgi:hypothetical protein
MTIAVVGGTGTLGRHDRIRGLAELSEALSEAAGTAGDR